MATDIQYAPKDISQIDLRNLPKVMNKKFYKLLTNQSPILVLVGGANSGKSTGAAQKVILRCILSKQKFLVLRKVKTTVRESVYEQLKDAIAQFGVESLWKENKSYLSLTYLPNKSKIICAGLDDALKLKSIHGISNVWIEEPTEITEEDFDQCDLRLRVEYDYMQILLSFNPIDVASWLNKRFFTDPIEGEKFKVVHTTYEDNTRLPKNVREKMDRLKNKAAYWWKVYGLGVWAAKEGAIYGGFDCGTPWPSLEHADDFYGLDFGYNAPTALERMRFLPPNRLYVKQELHQTKLTNTQLIARFEELEIRKDIPIFADNAEPDRIEEISLAGYSIFPCDKGKGSVAKGIDLIQSLDVYSCDENVDFNKEAETYSWQKIKGVQIDIPVNVNDHAMDAMRYGVYTYLRPRFADDTEHIIFHDWESEVADVLPDLY